MRLESLKASAAGVKNRVVFALDVSPGRRFEALLGMDILGGLQVASLDYSRYEEI